MAKTVEIGGKRRPVTFSFLALQDYEERTGRYAIPDIISCQDPQLVSVKTMVSLLYSAFVAGAEEAGIEVDFNQRQVASWFGSLKEATDVLTALTRDLEQDDPTQEGNGSPEPAKPKKAKPAPAE